MAIDIGAHIGLFTVVMARRAARVVAFEPAPGNRDVLRETIRLNRLDNVEIRAEAVSSQSGDAELHLDALDISPSCIKIDAEGSELAILCGAQRTIERYGQ